MSHAFLDRLAGAPVSWGVCEQPSWGIMLDVRRVLAELTSVGLHAIELGDDGFFPADDAETRALLAEYDSRMLGGFVSLLLHDEARRDEMLAIAEKAAARLAGTGATYFVTAAVMDYDWRTPTPLDRTGFEVLNESLLLVDQICARHGLTQVLHPHMNTMVETKRDVDLALETTSVLWCIDTGHLAIGGTNPLEFVQQNFDRVGLCHLKDVRLDVAERVIARELTTREAVDAGLFPPLGQGDVPLKEVVLSLEDQGYRGWYVHEQDSALVVEPAENEGPVADLRISIDWLLTDVVPFIKVSA
jgi:inosose dehydratase